MEGRLFAQLNSHTMTLVVRKYNVNHCASCFRTLFGASHKSVEYNRDDANEIMSEEAVMSFSISRVTRSSGAHPWRVIAFWTGLIVLSVVALMNPGLQLTSEFSFRTTPESIKGFDLLAERMGYDSPYTETVVISSDSLTIDDPAFQSVVTSVTASLRELPDIVNTAPTSLFNALELEAAGFNEEAGRLISADRRTTLIPVTLLGDLDASKPMIDIIHSANYPDVRVLTIGDVSSSTVFSEVAEEDLRTGEAFGVPIALLILVVVFGALVAAGVPVILAGISILVALGATALISSITELSFFVTNMISMIGLAVGIDYALFVVERYREERRRGYQKLDALERTGATASKAVLFSGITVVLATIGLFLIPTTIFRSLGLGAILVVIVAVVATLTLVPALISLLGDRLDWPRKKQYPSTVTAAHIVDEEAIRSGFWGRIVRAVMAKPVISLVLAVGVLLIAAIPYRDLNTGFVGAETLPPSATRDAYEILARDFSVGLIAPVEFVIDAPRSASSESAIDALRNELIADPTFDTEDLAITWNSANDLAHVTVPMNIAGSSPEAVAEIHRLRDEVVPRIFGAVDGSVYVTGETAFSADFFTLVDTWTPIVFVFVLGLSFLLLLVVFRSIVVPIKAILMNLLSVGAAYGLIVLVFQKGYLVDFFGFDKSPTIEAWIPIFLFCVLFGLSMDYHVFLLSRIREHYDLTGRNRESVAVGLHTTARIITGAALIMVAVFAGFAAGRLVMLQQVGFGLAVAVLIDATIIRTIVVPAAMALLGDRNWYLPKWLSWLPDIRVEGEIDAAASVQRPAVKSSES
jgi:RND superfamily putative drug exporter